MPKAQIMLLWWQSSAVIVQGTLPALGKGQQELPGLETSFRVWRGKPWWALWGIRESHQKMGDVEVGGKTSSPLWRWQICCWCYSLNELSVSSREQVTWLKLCVSQAWSINTWLSKLLCQSGVPERALVLQNAGTELWDFRGAVCPPHTFFIFFYPNQSLSELQNSVWARDFQLKLCWEILSSSAKSARGICGLHEPAEHTEDADVGAAGCRELLQLSQGV